MHTQRPTQARTALTKATLASNADRVCGERMHGVRWPQRRPALGPCMVCIRRKATLRG
ncbi:hypothetical protein [Leptothrix ochracea]|uniref:hypothetical protein n=1 Tax=Leptothrix ochracea TaxID=735331 RepID=UPI0034E2AD35